MTFSINQLFLIGLPFSMLEEKRGTYLIKQTEDYLMTTFGLRSLSPQNKYYKGRLSSPQTSKDSTYYTGAIWPWMIGMYVDAMLAFKGNSGGIITNLNKTVSSLEKFFIEQGLGNISEFFEGNPPHRRNGKICSGLNLTELLRSLQVLHRAKKEREGFSEYV
jgi:glycogen debranching enzyme